MEKPQIVQITAVYVINGGSEVFKGDCYVNDQTKRGEVDPVR